MDKSDFISQMNKHADAYITYISPISKKEKFNVGTLNFSTPYIKSKPPVRISKVSKPDEKRILVFCWDTDSFKQFDYKAVIKIEPLNQVMERAKGGRYSRTG
jgi:hypothetical protein